ncbi:hypothetical protein GCK72_000244 [Caenorhabditis remanei]|uniref:Uncharacterized protein n=1 Tax=Caenorhabditis remanei TaxID=31234 RepID=A0A6A5HRR2_CAERE|nr:hypothetical protein GCK72_000244 [Caenorhabditis remanei]KAF1768432.1 hypothetical protein GCK72_000244 [Caenorhabditis remanei]
MSEDLPEDIAGSSLEFELAGDEEVEEPSPLDRILNDGRSFNGGNWTSEELYSLLDGVIKYGTKPVAINYIHRNMVKKRTCEEIKVKIDEIREIIKEHKEITLPEEYKKKWIKMGYRNIVPPENSDVDPNENWSHIMGQVITHHQSSIMKHFNPMRDVMEKVFEQFALESKMVEDIRVTDMHTARATPSDTQNLRWPLIYQFMKACSVLEEQMPALNELEAAVVLRVLDSIEDEAATIPDSEKAILTGLFTECQMGDYRLVEQDYPPNLLSTTQLFVDPLRTRFHGIPEVGAEVELDEHNQNATAATDDEPSTSDSIP